MPTEGRRKTEDGKYGGSGARRDVVVLLVFLLSSAFFQGCGKKGPPLAPLNMAPEAPQEVVARRLGYTVYIQMKVPAKSLAGRGPFSVDRLEVYAVTSAPGKG